MARFDEHPTVVRHRGGAVAKPPATLDAGELRRLCLEAGADDVGFVRIDRPELDDQRGDILSVYPWTRVLISLVFRMNREPVRSPARSVANLEFHQTGEHTNAVARTIVAALEGRGIRAVNPAMGFPMEMDRFPGGKIWVVGHKPVAEAAGLGKMGIHRNVIHPRFGNFILLATLLVDVEVSEQSRPIEYNPCVACKLCVAACPVGAIGADGHFDLSACYTHNYREFMGGFGDWVEQIAESRSGRDYRRRVTDSETSSMWQSLGFGPNYKAAYCMAVCPAGEDVIGPFLDNRPGFLHDVVEPLQRKQETLYVVPGSDAQAYAVKRFPHKRVSAVHSGLRATSIAGMLQSLPRLFQRHRAEGLSATYHFVFRGEETLEATVMIRDNAVQVRPGLVGSADLVVRADSRTWLGFVRKERSLLWALVRRKVVLKGSPRWLLAFGRCFPS